MGKISVVIADDHSMLRTGIRKFLETAEDIRVAGEAANGAEAIECVNKTSPDVLLLDLHMPLGNGIEVVKALAAQNSKVRVLLLSMFSDRRFIEQLPHYEIVYGYLLKDEDPDKVLQAIRRVAAGERGVYSMEIARRASQKAESDPISYIRISVRTPGQPRAARPQTARYARNNPAAVARTDRSSAAKR